jgi:hypothetical protein
LRRFLYLLPCISVLFSPLPVPSAPSISPDPFLASPASLAFKAGRFEEALAGFQALLKEYPDDLIILRYIAITYDRLEHSQGAVAAFEKALALDAKNPALHFFLGETLVKMQEVKKAEEAFRRAMELGPDTLYAERAKQYLETMEQQTAHEEKAGNPKSWDLFTQVGFQFDDNVPLAPRKKELFTGPDREGFRATEFLAAGYQLAQVGGLTGKVDFSSYQSQHPERDLNDFNLSTYEPSLTLGYDTTLWGMAISPSLRYDFKDVLLKGDAFSQSHGVNARVNVCVTDNVILTPFYRLSVDRFDDDGFDPKISSRDAVNDPVGLNTAFLFMEGQGQVRTGYEYQQNMAEGSNFDSVGQRGSVGFSLPVVEEIRLDVNGQYSVEKSFHFEGPRDRRTKQQAYSAELSRSFWDRLSVTFSYYYTFADSNYAELEYIQGIFNFNVSVSF